MATRITYVRVKDKSTGHKFSVPESAVDETTMQALKQPAVDHNGRPLPAEHASPSSQSGQTATTSKKES